MSSTEEKKSQGRRGAGRRAVQPQETAPPSRGIATEPTTEEAVGAPSRGRGRGRGRGTTATVESSDETPHEDDSSPKGSPRGRDEDKPKVPSVENQQLALRPGFGTAGIKIQGGVFVNYFEVKVSDKKILVVVQYKVDITLGTMRLTRDNKRELFWKCVSENPAIFPSRHSLVFDGVGICYCLEKLNFPATGVGQDGKFELPCRLNRMDKVAPFKIIFELTGLVHVDFRDVNVAGVTADRYTAPAQFLDILFRQQRSCPLEGASQQWYPFASTLYNIPTPGTAPALAQYGSAANTTRVIWRGLFGSARCGQGQALGLLSTVYMNFDVANSGFYKPQSVLEFMVEVLNETFPNQGRRKYEVAYTGPNTNFEMHEFRTVDKAIRGRKIVTSIRKANGDEEERHYTVTGLSKDNAIELKFEYGPTDAKRMISVAEYFAERYEQLRYPKLPLMRVGAKKREIFLPVERCSIAPNQRVTELSPSETSTMIRNVTVGAPDRKERVLDLVRQSNFDMDPWLKKFGVRVNPTMKKVEARVLPAPKIRYAQGNGGARGGRPVNPVVTPHEGVWDARGQKFLIGKHVTEKELFALVLDRDLLPMYTDFFAFLLLTCKEMGMSMPGRIIGQNIRCARDQESIGPAIAELKRAGAKLIIVTLPEKQMDVYSEVKRVAELVSDPKTQGVMTQCVIKKNIMKATPSIVSNLALKINMKLGGLNSLADAHDLAKHLLLNPKEPTLVVGIDVAHPKAGQKKMPSVFAVVSNFDDSFMRYGVSMRVQNTNREDISSGSLAPLVKERLMAYFSTATRKNTEAKDKTQQKFPKPTRIIVFRDGVAESQFEKILREELNGVRNACQELGNDYKPKITFIVAQKRHHTRLFPTTRDTASGKGMNVIPGTVVDTDITHPGMFDFYLCSHFGIQGTSRPTHYHVLYDDSGFTSDHLQVATHYLTYVFARCTRSVSIPAPLYFADLACRRGSAYLSNKTSDFGSDTMSETSASGTAGTSRFTPTEDDWERWTAVEQNIKEQMYFT